MILQIIFDFSQWANGKDIEKYGLSKMHNHIIQAKKKCRYYIFISTLSIDINNHSNVDLLLSSMRTVQSTFKKIADDLVPYYFEVNTYNQKEIDKFVDIEGLSSLKIVLPTKEEQYEIFDYLNKQCNLLSDLIND